MRNSGKPLLSKARAKKAVHYLKTQYGKVFHGDSYSVISAQPDESVDLIFTSPGERNKLVHRDYATFPLEKTLEEIYDLYKCATLFVDTLPNVFRDCDGTVMTQPPSGAASLAVAGLVGLASAENDAPLLEGNIRE